MDITEFLEKISAINDQLFTKSGHVCQLKIDSFSAKNIVFGLEVLAENSEFEAIELYPSDSGALINLAVDIDNALEGWGYEEWCIGEALLYD